MCPSQKRIKALESSFETLLPTLETVAAFKTLYGFEDVCEHLEHKVVSTFSQGQELRINIYLSAGDSLNKVTSAT